MLTIKIELWPGGFQAGAFEIGRMYVYNISNLAAISDYKGVVCRRGKYEPVREAMDKATRKLEVQGYPREKYNVWRLITRSLLSAFPEEERRVARGSKSDDALHRVAEALGLEDTVDGATLVAAIERLKAGLPLPPPVDIPRFGND